MDLVEQLQKFIDGDLSQDFKTIVDAANIPTGRDLVQRMTNLSDPDEFVPHPPEELLVAWPETKHPMVEDHLGRCMWCRLTLVEARAVGAEIAELDQQPKVLLIRVARAIEHRLHAAKAVVDEVVLWEGPAQLDFGGDEGDLQRIPVYQYVSDFGNNAVIRLSRDSSGDCTIDLSCDEDVRNSAELVVEFDDGREPMIALGRDRAAEPMLVIQEADTPNIHRITLVRLGPDEDANG